eukprot:g12760.t1
MFFAASTLHNNRDRVVAASDGDPDGQATADDPPSPHTSEDEHNAFLFAHHGLHSPEQLAEAQSAREQMKDELKRYLLLDFPAPATPASTADPASRTENFRCLGMSGITYQMLFMRPEDRAQMSMLQTEFTGVISSFFCFISYGFIQADPVPAPLGMVDVKTTAMGVGRGTSVAAAGDAAPSQSLTTIASKQLAYVEHAAAAASSSATSASVAAQLVPVLAGLSFACFLLGTIAIYFGMFATQQMACWADYRIGRDGWHLVQVDPQLRDARDPRGSSKSVFVFTRRFVTMQRLYVVQVLTFISGLAFTCGMLSCYFLVRLDLPLAVIGAVSGWWVFLTTDHLWKQAINSTSAAAALHSPLWFKIISWTAYAGLGKFPLCLGGTLERKARQESALLVQNLLAREPPGGKHELAELVREILEEVVNGRK